MKLVEPKCEELIGMLEASLKQSYAGASLLLYGSYACKIADPGNRFFVINMYTHILAF